MTTGLGAALIFQIRPEAENLRGLAWPWTAAALGVSLAGNVVLASVKLWLLARWAGVSGLRLGQTHGMILGLLAATFFAPFQSGHLLYVAALASLAGIPLTRALEVVFLDKWLTVCATAAWMFVGRPWVPSGHLLEAPFWTLGALVLASTPFWQRGLRALAHRFPGMGRRFPLAAQPLPWTRMLVLLFLAMAYQSTDILATSMAARTLQSSLPWTQAFALVPLMIFSSWIPVTLSGIGIREHALAFLLHQSHDWRTAIQMGFLVDFTEYLFPALAGIPALPWLLQRLRKATCREDPS